MIFSSLNQLKLFFKVDNVEKNIKIRAEVDVQHASHRGLFIRDGCFVVIMLTTVCFITKSVH